MPEWIAPPGNGEALLPIVSLADLTFQLVVAFVFGCVAAGIHVITSPASRPSDRSFLSTLVLLSVLIAVVTIVIGNSLARAFSLAGVLAIVRFRTVVDDTRDIAFVIYTVVAGMAVGSEHYREPILVTPFVMIAAFLFRPAPIAKPPSHGILILRLAVGRPIDETIEKSLKAYLRDYHLIGLTTARGGAALDASYAIQLPGADKVFALVNELSRVEGVQGVEIKDN